MVRDALILLLKALESFLVELHPMVNEDKALVLEK
jgi:hypothetical protein